MRVLGRLIEHRLGARERGLIRLHLDLERPRIDAIQGIAGLHLGALMEQALDDDAGNARADFSDTRRRDAAGQLTQHRARLWLGDDNTDLGFGRRLRRSGRGSRLITAG